MAAAMGAQGVGEPGAPGGGEAGPHLGRCPQHLGRAPGKGQVGLSPAEWERGPPRNGVLVHVWGGGDSPLAGGSPHRRCFLGNPAVPFATFLATKLGLM